MIQLPLHKYLDALKLPLHKYLDAKTCNQVISYL